MLFSVENNRTIIYHVDMPAVIVDNKHTAAIPNVLPLQLSPNSQINYSRNRTHTKITMLAARQTSYIAATHICNR